MYTDYILHWMQHPDQVRMSCICFQYHTQVSESNQIAHPHVAEISICDYTPEDDCRELAGKPNLRLRSALAARSGYRIDPETVFQNAS